MSSSPEKRAVLIVTTLTAFSAPFMWSAVNVALPTIGRDLAMDAIELSWVVSAYTIASVIFVLPCGRLADIYGRKRIFSLGVIGFALSSLALVFSDSAMFLIAFRVAQGLASAMIFSTGTALISSAYQTDERGRALGFYLAAVYLGLSAGPFVGGILTQYLGWRSVFGLVVVLFLIIIVFIYWKLKGDWVDARGEKFDIVGSLIFSTMLFALVYGLSTLPAASSWWLIAVGILGLLAFIKWEMRVKTPLLDMNLYRDNKTFAFSSLAALINYSSIFSVTLLFSLYLQYIKGFSPQNAGLVLLIQSIVQVIVSPAAGRLSDRIQPRVVASIGMGVTAASLLVFAFVGENTSLLIIIAGLIILGVGASLFASPNTNAIMSSVPKKFYGIASAVVTTMRQTGIIVSMAVIMLLFNLNLGKVQITPQYYPLFLESMGMAFKISTVLCFCGVFVSLARGKTGKADSDNNNS
jgi:EmrB/QacA subfamily drug resistance transporter